MTDSKPRRRKDSGVGAWLAELRTQAGLSQAEVARRMGIDASAVWQLEAGWNDFRMSTLDRYTTAIGARVHIGLVDQAHTGPQEKRPWNPNSPAAPSPR
ncbi:helix-turn-helix domain-containing protein [Amycolatopsis sp. NPDC058340]|uniref:helix-turn-helix domain-containing protein n=1 Tax=Amycolatopsis sp. NPDC058340 TaxID=3346453 RepID=UPI0036551B00